MVYLTNKISLWDVQWQYFIAFHCMNIGFNYRIIFNENGYTTEECLRFKPVIFSNTIQSMLAILYAMDRLQISFENMNRKVLKKSYKF